MAKLKSWSVKGVDGNTRDLAREAAQASGMTIGTWIDRAILKTMHGELAEPQPSTRAITVSGPASLEDVAVEDIKAKDVATALPLSVSEPDNSANDQADISAEDHETEIFQPGDPGLRSDDDPIMPEATSAPEREPRRRLFVSTQDRLGTEIPANDTIAKKRGDRVSQSVTPEEFDGDRVDEPETPDGRHSRPSPVRFALAAVLLLVLFAGGIWVFVELSSTDRPGQPPIAVDSRNPDTKRPVPATVPTTTPAAPVSPSPAGSKTLPEEIRTGIALARAGNAKAQHDLGMLHLTGRYVKKDPAEAAKWFERGAVQGLASAQFNLGVLYQRGEGVVQNDRLAFFWYQSAAEQNFARAQHNLATAYAQGKGVGQSYPRAVEFFTKAASAGLSASQLSLAKLYDAGLVPGEPQLNLDRAQMWYGRAAAQGDKAAAIRVSEINADLARKKQSAAAAPASAKIARPTLIGRSEIQEIQTLLSKMNFNPGNADGQLGQRTADAIKLYQKFAGLEVDGKASQDLLEDLRAVAETMAKGS